LLHSFEHVGSGPTTKPDSAWPLSLPPIHGPNRRWRSVAWPQRARSPVPRPCPALGQRLPAGLTLDFALPNGVRVSKVPGAAARRDTHRCPLASHQNLTAFTGRLRDQLTESHRLAEISARYFSLVTGRPATSHASSPPRYHETFGYPRATSSIARLRASQKCAFQEEVITRRVRSPCSNRSTRTLRA
jgi:hypothetical protein